jgi:hypothetical protein
MVDWQITATTIYCDAVDAEVTIMVHKDWSTRCAICEYREGFTKHMGNKMLKKTRKKLNRELRCEGPECCRVIAYRDKLFSEEKTKNS